MRFRHGLKTSQVQTMDLPCIIFFDLKVPDFSELQFSHL